TKFGGEPKAYEVHFNLAEVDFFRLDKNFDAATHYMAAAKTIPASETSGPLAAMRHDALYNALVALSREMDGATASKQAAGNDSFARAADKYTEALDLYAQYYPRDPELPAMFLRQGRYYFDTGNYDSAVKILGSLLEKFPNSEQGREAGETILEACKRATDYQR